MGAVKSLFRFSAVRSKGLEPKRYPQPTGTAPSSAPEADAGKPNEEFLKRLKVVYVESKPNPTTGQENENPAVHETASRKDKLPQNRSAKLEDDFHLDKPQQGYLTTKQLMDIFNSKWSSPEDFTAHHVATKYAITSTDAENLLKYFTNYKIQPSGSNPKPDMKFHPLHR